MSEENLDHLHTEHLGKGMSFTSGYRNFEEMMEDQRRHEEAAIARMLPEQELMIHCDHDQWFVNLSVNPRELFIVGEAWSDKRSQQEELKSYGVETVDELSDEDKAAFKSSSAMQTDARKRGYIFGRAWSEIEPRGELGSTHVSCMWPISEAAFNEAREQEWKPDMEDEKKSLNLRTDMFTFWVKHGLGR